MPDPTLRFAAGSPERPFSSVWRIWAHGSDVYLGARTLLRSFKLSMHESGQWISALTSESGAVDKETGSRRQRTWTRPPEFIEGWTQGPINVLFSAPTVPPDGIKLVSEPGDQIVGSLPLSNGETVWLQARQTGISSDERNIFASVEREFYGFQVTGDADKVDGWVVWSTLSQQGLPLLIQFQLGKRHVQVIGGS